jgi:hypothetical protein
MSDKSDSDKKIPVNPILAKIVGDREGPANAMALMGYVGVPRQHMLDRSE